MSIIAWFALRHRAASFINRDAQPEPLEPGDSRFTQILEYMAWCNAEGACNARFKADGPRVQVLPPD